MALAEVLRRHQRSEFVEGKSRLTCTRCYDFLSHVWEVEAEVEEESFAQAMAKLAVVAFLQLLAAEV